MVGDEAIALRDMEAAAVRYAKDRKPESYVIPPKTQRVAVVGAGTAGLSCALHLAQKKYPVTVFDKAEGWGGVLRSHPRFAEFDADIALQFSTVEAEFRFGAEVKTLDELADFDAIYVATGAGGDSFGLLEGWEPRPAHDPSEPRVFMGGALCGADVMEGIAQGTQVSKTIEAFLQTGKAARTHGEHNEDDCGRYLEHKGAVSAPRVVAANSDGYSEEEARAEAARCLQCDCDDLSGGLRDAEELPQGPQQDRGRGVLRHGSHSALFHSRADQGSLFLQPLRILQVGVPSQGRHGLVAAVLARSRTSAGGYPAAWHDFWLREMDFATSEGAFASAPKGKETCKYAFYPGCQLGRGQSRARAEVL